MTEDREPAQDHDDEAAHDRLVKRRIAVAVMVTGLALFAVTIFGVVVTRLMEITSAPTEVVDGRAVLERRVFADGPVDLRLEFSPPLGSEAIDAEPGAIPLDVVAYDGDEVVHETKVDLRSLVGAAPAFPVRQIALTSFEIPWSRRAEVFVDGLESLPGSWDTRPSARIAPAGYDPGAPVVALLAFLFFGLSGLAVSIPGILLVAQKWRDRRVG